MATANQDPSNVLNYEVNFTTTNLNNGDPFTEPHFVSGPTPGGTFNIPLNAVPINGNKVVIPLSTNTAAGSFWLKLHLPQPGSSTMYITFAQKNSAMADGYYDYITGIPATMRTDLRNWIKDNAILNINQNVTKIKTLLFTVYGYDTNQVSSAIQFRVRFSALFGSAVAGGATTAR